MRVQGWQRLLADYILECEERYKAEGFAWGRFDCVHFVGDWVQRCTGEDPISEYRDGYSTKEEADALLETEGGLYQALVKRFGEPVHPAKAHRGDIAYVEDISALGIFVSVGAKTHAIFLGEGGFAMHAAKHVTHAFRVG